MSAPPRGFHIAGWMVIVEESGEWVVYGGPRYRTRADAEQDAELPRARGQSAEVVTCFEADVHHQGKENG